MTTYSQKSGLRFEGVQQAGLLENEPAQLGEYPIGYRERRLVVELRWIRVRPMERIYVGAPPAVGEVAHVGVVFGHVVVVCDVGGMALGVVANDLHLGYNYQLVIEILSTVEHALLA